MWTVVALTVQTVTVVEANVTALPDPPPVAVTVKSGSPNVLFDRAANVIVCAFFDAATVRTTSVAAR